MTQTPSVEPISLLLIEPSPGLATRLHELLVGEFRAALDLGLARSLRDGLGHLCTRQTDVVLLDLSLPDYEGRDAIRALRATAPATAVVALSAVAGDSLLLEAIGAGAHEALSAAVLTATALRSAIERALMRARHRSAPAAAAPLPAARRIVHDLNNAVTSVNGFADLLMARLPPDDPARDCAEQIRKAGTRAAALVKMLAPQPDAPPEAQNPESPAVRAAQRTSSAI